MTYIIDKRFDNKTVKEYITTYLDLSSKMITRLKNNEKGIMLNGKRVTVRAVMRTDDILELDTESELRTSDNIVAVKLPLDILFEDDHFIILNKPPYMPTHPSHDHYRDTLANAISFYYESKGVPFVFRAVNRLDKNTSGIVIFAKSSTAANLFSRLQQNKLVTKKYLALVEGKTDEHGIIEGYIRRRDKSIILREFSTDKQFDNDAYSKTEYNTLASNDYCSLLELKLWTGRTHQIRVHTKSIGHSILGDDLYGTEGVYSRHMLHSHLIKFEHPFTKKEICITASIPDDFLKVMKEKGIEYEL